MPMKPVKSKKVISENIKMERRAGKPEKQAVAIAMNEADKSKKMKPKIKPKMEEEMPKMMGKKKMMDKKSSMKGKEMRGKSRY